MWPLSGLKMIVVEVGAAVATRRAKEQARDTPRVIWPMGGGLQIKMSNKGFFCWIVRKIAIDTVEKGAMEVVEYNWMPS